MKVIGIDMVSGEDFARLTLLCKCGTVEDFATQHEAYESGWRVKRTHTKEGLWEAVCPSCMAESDRKHFAHMVKLYGYEAASRGELIAREKHR